METSPSQPRFEPWRIENDENEWKIPSDQSRSLYISPPTSISRTVSETYAISTKPEPHFNTFTRFANLPFELRIKIWVLSMSDPRVVPVFYNNSTKTTRSDCPVPPQLHVSYEARQIALRHYDLSFGTGKQQATVYFDFSKDELYFGAGNIAPNSVVNFMAELSFGSKELLAQCQKIQKITIDDDPRLWDLFINRSDEVLGGVYPRLLDILSISGLRLFTIVRAHGNSDVVLAEVENNPGEVQAWNVCPEGRVSRWTSTDLPDDFGWRQGVLNTLMDMETIWRQPLRKSDDDNQRSDTPTELGSETKDTFDDEPIITFRCVSMNRLSHLPAWKKRHDFLQGKMLVPEWNCLISKGTGFFDFLTQLTIEHPELSRDLSAAFIRKFTEVPIKGLGYKFEDQDLNFNLYAVSHDLLTAANPPCLCRTTHEDRREPPRQKNNLLPLVEYLVVDWMADKYLRVVAERVSWEAHVDYNTDFGERNVSRLIGIKLLETIKENMAKAIQDWIEALGQD